MFLAETFSKWASKFQFGRYYGQTKNWTPSYTSEECPIQAVLNLDTNWMLCSLTVVTLSHRIKKWPLKYSHLFCRFDQFMKFFQNSKIQKSYNIHAIFLRVVWWSKRWKWSLKSQKNTFFSRLFQYTVVGQIAVLSNSGKKRLTRSAAKIHY